MNKANYKLKSDDKLDIPNYTINPDQNAQDCADKGYYDLNCENFKSALQNYETCFLLRMINQGKNYKSLGDATSGMADALLGLGKLMESDKICNDTIILRKLADDSDIQFTYQQKKNIQKAIDDKKIQHMNICNNVACYNQGLMSCARCNKTFYCKKECQKVDWKFQHKNNCIQ